MTVPSPESVYAFNALSNPSAGWLLGLPMILLLSAIGGCASSPGAYASTEYLIAARYNVSQASESPGDKDRNVTFELQRLRALGFNAVVFDYVDDQKRSQLSGLAAENGLQAYVTDSDLHDYLLTGRVRGADSLDELVRIKVRPLSSLPGFAGIAVLGGYPKERASAAIAALESRHIPCLVPGQSGYSEGGSTKVAWLDAQGVGNPKVSQVERLLLEFNGELFAGWTDGMVVDLPLDATATEPSVGAAKSYDGLLAGGDSERRDSSALEYTPVEGAKSRGFAVESLIRRARHWGTKLRGCSRVLVSAPDSPDDPLSSALFVRGQRRFLFLFNQLSEPQRRTVRFPGILGGRALVRAVEVPATADRLAGEIFTVRSGGLVIQVRLRAGDAALFELF